MSPAAWAALGAGVGPLLLFITAWAARRQQSQTAGFEAAAGVVNSALSTTETMRLLLQPLEEEIAELRSEIVLLRTHVTALETQVRELGGVPASPEYPPYGRIK